ncbi:hypothetical protein diail_2054 [Diaporthe ilicicola]|nr:hypothetical protein diail_2054 [Diaporthe ilicicola]
MDLINKFKHNEEPEQKHDYTDSAAQTGSTQDTSYTAPQHDAEEPKRDFLGKLIGGSGHHGGKHESGDEDKSFFDKLTSKEDREKKKLELEKRELELNYELEKVLKEKKDNEGFFEKLKDKFDGDIDKEKVVQHENEPKEDEKPSFFDKLTGKDEREKKAIELDRKEAEVRAELEKVKHDKKENQDLLERIKDHLDGDDDEQENNAKAHDKPSFFDKITGKAEEEERRRKEEENKNAFEKMQDRINENLGGGRKAEEKEDFLDKTIDGFEEHILHRGDQSNESAFEQAKDAQIAAAIRKQLHLKDDKEKH